MFDLSWAELLFVAILAIIVVGPRELPRMFNLVGRFFGKLRRLYQDMTGSIRQLEREVNIAEGNVNQQPDWQNLMPEHLRHLPKDFVPGSISAEQHQQRNTQREAFIKSQEEKNNRPD